MSSPPRASESPAVYIHVPFCAHRCGYCNFALVADRDYLIDRFLSCLEIEIRNTVERIQPNDMPIETLFFGGGTPSHLNPGQIRRLLKLVHDSFPISDQAEISIEVNPNDLDQEKSEILEAQRVNRVSLGVQSFDRLKLSKLERTHGEQDIERAVERARNFAASVSLDLIFGTAGETNAIWQSDLDKATALPIDHLSTYALTVETGTAFYSRDQKGQSVAVDEDSSAELYEIAVDTLTARGFEQYEISSFARAGHRCRHNQNYWNLRCCLAFGPGAASFDGRSRRRNHQSVSTYLKRIESGQDPVDSEETLDEDLLARERLIFGLRQLAGIDLDEFEQQTGHSPEGLVGQDRLERLIEQGMMSIDHGRLSLTRQGVLVSDSIWVEFL